MAVKAGYKQTEIGVIPEDWQILSVGALLKNNYLIDHIDGNHGELYPKSHEFKPFGVPYIRATDFFSGTVSYSDCRYLSATRAAQFKKGISIDNDVLFAHNATVGPVALLKIQLPFVIISTTATYYRANLSKLSNLYLMHTLRSHLFADQYKTIMAQSTRNQVPITAQRKLKIIIPPLPEQHAIAQALSDVDELIARLDQLIEKRRALKTATMQQLLTGKTRLAGFSGEWQQKTFGNLGNTYGGLTGKTKSDFGIGDAKYVTFMNVMSNVLLKVENFEHVAVKPEETQNRVRQGDLLFNGSSETPEDLALCSFVGVDVDELFLNSFCFGFRLKETSDADGRFLAYYVRSDVGRKIMQSLAQGSTRYNVSKSAFLKAKLHLPPSHGEQVAIAATLSDMDAELTELAHRRDKTIALKQGMMQELLTGRTRLV